MQLADFIGELLDKQIVPENERAAKLEAAHSKGHFGAEAIFQELWHAGFYWPNMKRDCQSLVAICLV